MKVTAALILVACGGLIAACGWLVGTYSIVRTDGSDEWLILRSDQARECAAGGGCAVWSRREFVGTMQQACGRKF